MDGPSRLAIATLRDDLARVPVSERRVVAADLYAVRDLVAGSLTLARTLTDPATTAEGRAALVNRLLAGKVGSTAMGVVDSAVRARWSRTRDLADALEQLGNEAVLAAAEDDGRLDAVEDDLFRLARIVERSPELALALSAPAQTGAAKAELIGRLLTGKADPDAELLARRAVLGAADLPLERALTALVTLAAARRMQLVAVVASARPLSEASTTRLAAALHHLYGKNVRIQADVDPTLIGGLIVHVGDEVVDGSVLRRLTEARAALTR